MLKRCWKSLARALSICALIGLAIMGLGSSADADAVLKLEDGVAPHPKIDQLYERLAASVAALDSSGFSSVYAEGVYYLVPQAPLARGLDSVNPHWDGWFTWMKEGDGSLKMSFRVIAREIHGDSIGYDVGYYKILQKRPNEPDVLNEGKLVVVTKKQANGDWRFQVDAYNGLKKSE